MRKYRFLIGAAVVAAGLIFVFVSGFKQSTATQMTLASLISRAQAEDLAGQPVQLGGSTVVPGSIVWDEYRSRPQFMITDGAYTLQARYTGSAVLPDTFQDRAQVVLEGEYDPHKRVFNARTVMAKCPSKYEGQRYEDHVKATEAG